MKQFIINVIQGANGVIVPGTTTVNYGENSTFTISPNTGYYIASLTVNGSPVPVASSYTFNNVQAPQAITATFEINTYTIAASAGTGGSISPSGSVSVNYGGNQSFDITENAGYYIVDVTVNGSSVGAVNSYIFSNVQAAYTILATFAPSSSPAPSPISTSSPSSIATPTATPPTATFQPTPPSSSSPPNNTASTTAAKFNLGQLIVYIAALATTTIIIISSAYTLIKKRQLANRKVVSTLSLIVSLIINSY